MSFKRAFTLIEVLVVIGIVAVLMALSLVVMAKSRESGRRLVCGNNLKVIGQALLEYAEASKGNQFPRIIWQKAEFDSGMPYQEPAPDLPNPFANAANGYNASHAGLFLLIRTGFITDARVFVCPSTDDFPDNFAGKDPRERSNFTVLTSSPTKPGRNNSYSYTNMYPSVQGTARGVQMTLHGLNPRFPLVADRSWPRCNAAEAFRNSRNHREAGQNVLFTDGSVTWATDTHVGVNGDDIYIAKNGEHCNTCPVAHPDDTIMQEN